MSGFRYPVDTDQFQGIRERGLLYVDKTDMMYNLASKYRYVFLARPRRFGKSLLCNTFMMDTVDLERNATILAMARALRGGDLSAALAQLRSWIASLPYDIITRKEWMAKKKREAFYQMLMYIVFSLLNSKVDTEVKSILGRADVVIKTDTHVFVLELKVDDSVENALAQIDDKGYAIPYETEGRTLIKCGANISSEARNITHWRITDADGNIIDEQKF